MASCPVAQDCIVGNNVIISNATQLAGEVEVDDFAVVGGGSLVHQFCRLGKHVMIQGGALINKDVPPYCKAAREPIAYTGINSVGLRRRNFSVEAIDAIQETYHMLYMSGLNISDAVEKIAAEMPSTPEREEILNFVRSSSRGIIRGHNA
jgi:UDP-N-acetylglucosamine acyltransferase